MGDTGPDPYELSLRLERRFGVPPLICTNGKAALHKRWQVDPFTRPDVVRNRLHRHRGHVGTVMGAGRVGIDLDTYKPEGAETHRMLTELGWLPPTASQRTQSGGLHLLYRYDPALWEVGCGDFAKVTDPDGTFFPGGAEWKGTGGYLVVYEWDETPIADIHPGLAEALGGRLHHTGTGRSELHPKTLEACTLLEQYFGAHHRVPAIGNDGRPYVKLTRPDKDAKDGTSVSVGERRDGTSFFHTPNWSPFEHRQVVDLWELRQMAEVDPGPKIHVTQSGGSLALGYRTGSEVTMWLWEDRIPSRQFVIAAGIEKLGKSSALVWMCARLTTGDLPGDYQGRPLTVAYISAEDDSARILKPRFQAAGGDDHRYYLLTAGGVFTLAELKALDPRPDVVVFDPISAFVDLRSGSNEHGEIAVRQALAPYHELAVTEGITVVGVRHGKKGAAGDNPLDMVMGSKAWAAAARALLIFAPDREHEGRPGGLIFGRGNLAAPSSGFRYRLDQVPVVYDNPVVRPSTGELVTEGLVNLFVPEGESRVTLDEALGPKSQATERIDAEAFLAAELVDREEHLLSELLAAATEEGIAERTLHRARQKLRLTVRTEGFGKQRRSWWKLPPD